MISFIAVATLGSLAGVQAGAPVELLRVFKAGEKYGYSVKSRLVTETKRIGMPYFQPSDVEFNYGSTFEVKAIKADGFADVVYRRPFMEIIEGEDSESGQKVTKQKVNVAAALTISPINEVTSSKEITDTPGTTKPKKPGRLLLAGGAVGQGAGVSLSFVQEIYRLALNIGSLDTSLDLAPKLPLDEVKPGDTWKSTAQYQPQVLKGTKDKMAVQRLDWTYKYEGVVDSGGKKVHRISGLLTLDTDAGAFINQASGMKASETGIQGIPIKMESKVSFDLDLATKQTLNAQVTTKGSWTLNVVGAPETVIEERFNGTTNLNLVKK